MIYEYPEEFIVPVIYVNDLREKVIYRCEEAKSSHLGKLIIPDEDLQDNEIFLAKIDVDIYGEFKDKDINMFKLKKEMVQEPIFNGDIVEEELKDKNIKDILSDIDEDYANSETKSR